MAGNRPELQPIIDRSSAVTTIHPSTKDELIHHFRTEYGDNWRPHAARYMSGEGPGSTKYKSAMRHFSKDRINSQPRKAVDREKWAQWGKGLPPVERRPNKPLTIMVKGTQYDPYGGYRERVLLIPPGDKPRLAGIAAYQFVNDPSYAQLWDLYGHDFDADADYPFDVDTVTIY